MYVCMSIERARAMHIYISKTYPIPSNTYNQPILCSLGHSFISLSVRTTNLTQLRR